MTGNTAVWSRPGRAPIVLAAGGTGGHMFPAEALARELLARGEPVVLVTDRRGQAFGEKLPEVTTYRIRSATFGRGLAGKARTVTELIIGYVQASRLLKALRPAAIVGFGGYPSVPTVLAGERRGVPVLLHEQNALLGRANRLLARRARVIATSFPSVSGLGPAERARTVMTGNPVRPAITALRHRRYATPDTEGELQLLVLGGSQGAHVFSEVVPEAVGLLPEHIRSRIKVAQQCRPEDLEQTRAAYQRIGIPHDLAAFFTDVPERLTRAHLVLCRAGASTVAELAVAGRPAILVPYPYAMDDHQTANAQALAGTDGGWVVPQETLTPETLAHLLEALFGQPGTLARAAAAAWTFGTDGAAARLSTAVLNIAGRRPEAGGGNTRANAHREAAE